MEQLNDSFRFALSRQLVGEVRGPEAWPMLKAMESGPGSMCTTHATDAEGALAKLVTCSMEAGAHVTSDLAVRKLAQVVDLVVYLRTETITDENGHSRKLRWVSEETSVIAPIVRSCNFIGAIISERMPRARIRYRCSASAIMASIISSLMWLNTTGSPLLRTP